MEILLKTDKVWEIEPDVDAIRFVDALQILLEPGDVIVFGAYEPASELMDCLVEAGSVVREDIPEFHTSFVLNRDEHPRGCAFELALARDTLADLVRLGSSVLRQRDKDAFFDHVLAYRPSVPKVPLLSFHAAFNGGTLLLSGIYDEGTVRLFSSRVEGSFTAAANSYSTDE